MTPEVKAGRLRRITERLWDERGRGVPFEQTSMAKLIDELERQILDEIMVSGRLRFQLSEREMQLAEALGEVRESDEGERSPGLEWDDLVEHARDLHQADVEREP